MEQAGNILNKLMGNGFSSVGGVWMHFLMKESEKERDRQTETER